MDSAINDAVRHQPFVQRRVLRARDQSRFQRGLCRLIGPQQLDEFRDALQLRPDRFEPRLVLRQHCVADTGPEHDAVFLPVAVSVLHHLDPAVGLLMDQLVGDAVARLPARAEHRCRFEQKRAVHDPQTAITGRPDLERRHPVLDFARLPDVADG